jgi:hypothetical protein
VQYFFAKTERLCYVFREQDGPTPLLARACWREEKERLRRSVRNLKHEFEAEKIFLFGLAVTH